MRIISKSWSVKHSSVLWGVLCAMVCWGTPSVHAQEETPNPTIQAEATPKPKEWSAGTGIGTILNDKGEVTGQDGRMTAPQDQTKDPIDPKQIVVMPFKTVGCSVESATDMDHWTRDDNDGDSNNNNDYDDDFGDAGDGVHYQWSASGGRFEGSTTGTGATWVAPAQSGRYTITCTIDDTPTPIETPETGTRNDDAVTRSCEVVVPSVSLEEAPDSGTTVAAGAFATAPHQADFRIKMTDDNGNPLAGQDVEAPSVIAGGKGPYEAVTASVQMLQSTTDGDGFAYGKFTSGNRTENMTIAMPGDPDVEGSYGATLDFGQVWNELTGEDAWTYEPYFEFDVPSTVTYHMAYDRQGQQTPITGHSLELYTSGIQGFEWNPDAGEDWDGDTLPDGDYEPQSYSDEDSDSTGFDMWSGLVEWGPVSESGGNYSSDQTIWWNEDFITEYVSFWVYDNNVYEESGYVE